MYSQEMMLKNYSSNTHLYQPFHITAKTNLELNSWPHLFVKLAKLEVTKEAKRKRKNVCLATRRQSIRYGVKSRFYDE
jgi:hypothetical protein